MRCCRGAHVSSPLAQTYSLIHMDTGSVIPARMHTLIPLLCQVLSSPSESKSRRIKSPQLLRRSASCQSSFAWMCGHRSAAGRERGSWDSASLIKPNLQRVLCSFVRAELPALGAGPGQGVGIQSLFFAVSPARGPAGGTQAGEDLLTAVPSQASPVLSSPRCPVTHTCCWRRLCWNNLEVFSCC